MIAADVYFAIVRSSFFGRMNRRVRFGRPIWSLRENNTTVIVIDCGPLYTIAVNLDGRVMRLKGNTFGFHWLVKPPDSLLVELLLRLD